MTGLSLPIRSFVAVPLPARIQADVFAAAQALSRDLPAVRWSRKMENLHVTLKFLGPVTEERLAEVGVALDRALGALPPFGVEVRGIGAFPSARAARVVWVGVDDGAGRLAEIAETVEGIAATLGVGDRETRPFRAHVTVGRSKADVDARAALAHLGNQAFGRVAVEEVQLLESRLGTAGSTYVLRSRAALRSN